MNKKDDNEEPSDRKHLLGTIDSIGGIGKNFLVSFGSISYWILAVLSISVVYSYGVYNEMPSRLMPIVGFNFVFEQTSAAVILFGGAVGVGRAFFGIFSPFFNWFDWSLVGSPTSRIFVPFIFGFAFLAPSFYRHFSFADF